MTHQFSSMCFQQCMRQRQLVDIYAFNAVELETIISFAFLWNGFFYDRSIFALASATVGCALLLLGTLTQRRIYRMSW